jgi:spore maturation protein CgeB
MPDHSPLSLPPRRRILYAGPAAPGSTTGHRMESLRRLGQEVIAFDSCPYQPRNPLIATMRYRFPTGPLVRRINDDLMRAVHQHKPDVVWFDKPLEFTARTVRGIRQTGAVTVCYTLDNPFGPRNDGCWYQFRKVFRLFDLHCVPRTVDVARYSAWGLNYVKVLLSYEPSAHFPPPDGWSDARRNREISYIGYPYEERPRFLLSLAQDHHLPISISGRAWEKVLTPELAARHLTSGFLAGDAYREAIWKSKINLSFITRLNEEDIAHKAVEIAACEGFLLAIRTSGHQEIFEEDREAVFFSSVEECADKCRFYLGRPDLRDSIARRGRERAARSGYDNDTQLRLVLNRLDGNG